MSRRWAVASTSHGVDALADLRDAGGYGGYQGTYGGYGARVGAYRRW